MLWYMPFTHKFSYTSIIRVIGAGSGESEVGTGDGHCFVTRRFSVDGGERSGVRHGPCRALAPVDGVGEQDVVGDGQRRPGGAGRPLWHVPPVVRRHTRDAGADDPGSTRACRWQPGGSWPLAAVVRVERRLLEKERRDGPERDGVTAALDADARRSAYQPAGWRRAAERPFAARHPVVQRHE